MKTEVKNFTILLDELIQRHGIIAAAVFGRMWRYSQQRDGVCYAAIETIAENLNISRPTVHKHIKTLVKSQYIIDTTPGLKNRPHTYSIPENIILELSVSVKNFDSTVKNFDSTVKNLVMKKEVNKGNNKETPLPEQSKQSLDKQIVEDKKNQSMIPEELNDEHFLNVWSEWKQYRKEIKKPLKTTTIKYQMKKLKKYKPETAAAMLIQSIENQWQGIFELKNGDGVSNSSKLKHNKDGSIYV